MLTNKTPNPGSPEAIKVGRSCPRMDNRKSFNCLVQIEDTLAPVNLNSLIDNHAKNN